jgi:hypothetical protein
MNGEIFLAYVEQFLVPTLRRNDIVVVELPFKPPRLPPSGIVHSNPLGP